MNDRFDEDEDNITEQVLRFREFLITAWYHLSHLLEGCDWGNRNWPIERWVQFNWEFLVEREFLGTDNGSLLPFAKNYPHRVTPKPEGPTYAIIVKGDEQGTISNKEEELVKFAGKNLTLCGFYGSVSQPNQRYFAPPFSMVELSIGEEVFFAPLKEMQFYLNSQP